MQKIFLLAPDSFKESMTAVEACQAMEKGIHSVLPHAQCIYVPMADGGEGTVDALLAVCDGEKVDCLVQGPLFNQRISTYFALIDQGQTAVIEMAKANGIHLVQPHERNPMLTSTLGTGQMILHALSLGVTKIIVGLGGSVTNDAGAGMASALGARFLNASGELIQPCGANLTEIVQLDVSLLDPRLAHVDIIIASDVTNPLCGSQGASVVFAPQKGATAKMVEALDQQLAYFANLVEGCLNIHCQHIEGAGAAGGLGFAFMAFARAKIQSGAQLMIEQLRLTEKIAEADYVFTGEGSIDFQTQFGKTPWAVAQVAKQYQKPVIAFAGRVSEDIASLYEQGFDHILCINPPDCNLEIALSHAQKHLAKTCEQFVRAHIQY